MCGIFGYYLKSTRSTRINLHSIKPYINHRGPDDYGIFENEYCGLLHTRLSIIDLSEHGKQPLENENGNLKIIFNGEIYNHQELRHRLINKGHKFHSKTDTECIVHAYEEHGDLCVKHLRGMYAFCILNESARSLFLARDRIGQKPLYYYNDDQFFIFASEIGAILAALETYSIKPKISKASLAFYLERSTIPFPFSAYENIQKLPPATTLKINTKNEIKIQTYWNPDLNPKKILENEALQQLDKLMTESVGMMLNADVPVALLLSGGVDSSGISALTQQIREKHEISSFSLTFNKKSGEDPDVHFSKLIAKKYNIKHNILNIDDSHIDEMPKLISHYREPLTPGIYQTSFIYNKIKEQNIKVILSGDCADELFCGYEGSKKMKLLSKLNKSLPDYLKQITVKSFNIFSKNQKLKNLLSIWASQPNQYLNSYLSAYKQFPQDFLTSKTKDDILQLSYNYNLIDTNVFLRAWSFWDLVINCGNTTVISDIGGMHHGVEVRAPFLDHKLVEFAFSLPQNLLISQNKDEAYSNKYILKKYFERYLPKELLYRKKIGFGSSNTMSSFIRNEWKAIMNKNILNDCLQDLNLLDSKYINKIMTEHMKGSKNHDNLIWKLFNINVLIKS